MAKFTITRLLDTTRISKTNTGKEIPEFFEYLAQFIEQTVRNLRSGLTFGDNFASEVKTVNIKSGTAQVITASKTVTGIIPVRVQTSLYLLQGFGWYYDRNNRLTIVARLCNPDGTSAPTDDLVPMDLVLLY